jgi:phage tail protein X
VRRHRIAEGDTLARLAEQYLGSRDRYLELFQANADVLFDPRLIPIGVEIVIPDRTTIIAQAATTPATVDDAAQDSTPPASEAPATP